MAESEVFSKLVKELDPVERKELLEKLEIKNFFEAEPMVEKVQEEETDLEKEYYSLGLITRIIIFFKVAFRGENKFEITEEIILKRIERQLKRSSGDILSGASGKLNEIFLDEISKLHESADFFKPELNAVGGSRRDEFLNFLGSLQIPVIHRQLMLDSDFERTEEKTGLKEPVEVRKEVLMNVEKNLDQITGELRRAMYLNSQTVFILGELAKFDFNGFEQLFNQRDSNEKTCYFGDARIRLERLTEILSSFRISPDRRLLEAFYLFHNDSLKVEEKDKLESGIRDYLTQAANHIKIIKKFNEKMQLARVMKIITGNVDYKPEAVSGGEDWFKVYNAYWENKVENNFRKYQANKRRMKIYQDMKMYFKKESLPSLEYYNLRYKYSCGFLNSFLLEQFTTDMHEVLKKILVDGKFYKKNNKDDFTVSYSALLGMYEKLKKFDEKNSAKGEYGLKLEAVNSESATGLSKEQKTAGIIESSDKEAYEIIKKALESLLTMKNVLYGILFGKAGGQYDSLSNLNRLITIDSRDFIIDLNEIYNKIEDAYRILGDILSLEEV